MAGHTNYDLRRIGAWLDLMADLDGLVTDSNLPLYARDSAARVTNKIRAWLSSPAMLAPLSSENETLSEEVLWGIPTQCSFEVESGRKLYEQPPRPPARSSSDPRKNTASLTVIQFPPKA